MEVAQSRPTLCNPMDYTAHGILQARTLKWVAVPFSRGTSQPRDQSQVSCIAGGFFTSWATKEAHVTTFWDPGKNAYRSVLFQKEAQLLSVWRGDSCPWVSPISVHLLSRGADIFCSELNYQGYLYSKQSEKIECLFLERRAGLFAVQYKI